MLADHGKALEPVQLVARAEDRARGDNGEDQLPALLAPEDGSCTISRVYFSIGILVSRQRRKFCSDRIFYLKIVS